MFREYHVSGSFWNGQGCVNNTPLTFSYILDDLLEPYSFQSVFLSYIPSCGQNNSGINLVNRFGHIVNGIPLSCFHSGTTNPAQILCGRFGGTVGLEIVRGDPVETPPELGQRWSCVDGQCRSVFEGAFSSLEECRQHCRPLGGRCNCPPPNLCISQEEYRRVVRKLSLLRRVLTG